MTIEFDPETGSFTPYVGELSSFGSQADGKAVKAGSVTFRGNAGAGWVTIATDEYHVRRKSGKIVIREIDDDGNLVDWQDYIDYQDAGNTAFRATYTVKNGATESTYTNETVTMAESDPYLGSGDGSFDGEIPKNLYVEEIHALYGEIGGWILSSTQLTSDSGSVFIDSSVPSIGLGATGYQSGTGFWVGKSGGVYKLYIGDATNKQMYWDGSSLTVGGFTIGADYLRDAANSFGLASTVTGGDDVRFWAGAAFASRASAPFRVTKAGAVTATNITITGGAIDGAVINALSITAGKIGNLEITAAQIANSTITGAKIDSSTVTGGNIASGTITAGNMADLTITAGKIANLTITAAQIDSYTLQLGNLTQEVINGLSQADARNQLYNGGFEDGQTFWNGGTVQTNSANAHSGNKYLEMSTSGTVISIQIDETTAYRRFQVDAGQTIRFSAWGYRTSGDKNVYMTVWILDKDGSSVSYHTSNSVTAATWTQIQTEFTAESNAKYAVVYFAIDGGTTTTTARFDDAALFILMPGSDIVARSITADRIVAGTITANEIAASTITANEIAASTITAGKLSISTLSAISADMGTITAGTVTGATIRTASSGARTEMNASNLFSLGFGGIGGYDGSAVQWYAKNSDGKIYAAGGKLVIDATALALYDGSSVVSAYLVGASTTLNGESLVAGDVLFGDNSSNQSNVLIQDGVINVRSGTTKYIQVGPKIATGINGSGFASEFVTLAVGSGANKDLDEAMAGTGIPIYANSIRVTSTGNWTLRSIVTGVYDGQWLFLINESANNMTIENSGAAPAGFSAIRTFDGSSPATTNTGCALLIYNDTNGTWDLMSYRG